MIKTFCRRWATAILLLAGAGLLQGCAYDPYSGAYVPCCASPAYATGYPAYGYPTYGYPGYGATVSVGPGGYYRGGYAGGYSDSYWGGGYPYVHGNDN
jgi:hypothetical protein